MKVKLTTNNIKDNYIHQLLSSYGIKNIDTYLHPNIDMLQSPEFLINIHDGYKLFDERCARGNRILLIVDSDVDGYTSATIFYQYAKKCNPNLTIDYKLHSGKQHGLEDHIDWIEENPIYDLVVCPDASSNDFEYHERLKVLGIPVLVLDHHIPDNKISDNAIIINNQISPNYSNKDLTGAGVVFQFCRYLDKMYNTSYSNYFIDLAALGIDGDMGSLLDLENRYIVNTGFKNIKNFFFQTLVEKQSYSMNGLVTPISVAFYIVPMINAMIRIGEAAEKDRLFRAFLDGTVMVPSNKRGAKGQEELLAIESARECTNARNHQNKFKEKAVETLEKKIQENNLLDNKVLFIRLDDEDFPSELNGLVAMQLSAKYKKPTIVARLNEEDMIRGSARGLNNSELDDFRQFLTDSNLFEYCAGHANAFGISIENRVLSDFHEYANKALDGIDFNESCYEAQFQRNANSNDISAIIEEIDNYKDVWGTNVPEPLIYVTQIPVQKEQIKIMGKNQDTLKITYNGIAYMKFHAKELIEELAQYSDTVIFNIIGRGNMNYWGGYSTPQIFIDNYEIKTEKENLLSF